MQEIKERLHLLDALRGFAIINVVIYHFLYDYYVVSGLDPYWDAGLAVRVWQRLGCGLFVVIAGMAFHMSSGNLRRGLQLNLLGLVITAVTYFVMPSQVIYYGILNFFGCALWLTALLAPCLKRVPARAGMAVCVALYLLTMNVRGGDAAILGVLLWQWPAWLYSSDAFALLGFHSSSFHSADYVPLLPHIFLLWLGWYAYGWLVQNKLCGILKTGNIRVLTLPGRHSLAIYLIHQPLLFALGMLL